MLFVPASPGARDAASLADVGLHRGHADRRLAGACRSRLRHHHRRGPAPRGRGAALPLPRRGDRQPPRVLLASHAGRAGGVAERGRAPHVHGRQRLLLAHRLSPGAPRSHRGAPRGGRHPHLGRAGGRVPHELHGRAGAACGAGSAALPTSSPGSASSARASTPGRPTGAGPRPAIRGPRSSSKASTRKWSETTASASAGPRAGSSTA